jgi:predicted transcriptional regulator
MAVKMSVNLPDETVESLRHIAEKNGITLTAALRQAIANEKFLEDELHDDSKLLIEGKDQSVRQVVFSKR